MITLKISVLSVVLLMAIRPTFTLQFSTSIAVLKQISKCPSGGLLNQLERAADIHSLALCVIACDKSYQCALVYFSALDSGCYHGDSNQLTALDSQSPVIGCVSYVKDIVLASSPTPSAAPSNEATTQSTHPTFESSTTPPRSAIPGLSPSLASKLLIFFDFRHSFTNLANPTKYWATAFGGVVRDSQGAQFPGSSADFIEVDTDGGALVSGNLDFFSNFSFYARVIRQAWSHQNYHYFHDCSGNLRGEFGDHNGQLWSQHAFSNQTTTQDKTETIQSAASNMVPTDNTPSHVSAAAVFTGIHFSTFIFNGTVAPGSPDLNYSFGGLPVCLRLGYHSAVNYPLRGRFICYAVAKAALGAAEVAELGQFCAAAS